MKTIIGAIALILTVPAIGQTASAAKPISDHSACQASGQRQGQQIMADMHKSCGKMMKHHAKMHRKGKTEADKADAEVNGNGHQGHNH